MCLALPGKIQKIEVKENHRIADVEFGGIIKKVNLDYVPKAECGDYVNVHVGFALSIIDAAEAREVIEHMQNVVENNQRKLDEIRGRIQKS